MIATIYRKVFRRERLPAGAVVPACGGCLMLVASLFPWLQDPLGVNYTAWGLPLDLGWGFHITLLNYGLLCLLCALYCFSVAWRNWRSEICPAYSYKMLALCCLAPVALFLLQYLCFDLSAMNQLAQHSNQMSLIQHHLGYKVGAQLFPMSLFGADISTVEGRWLLVENYGQIGLLLPCVTAWILIDASSLNGSPLTSAKHFVAGKRRAGLLLLITIAFVAIIGRAAGWMVCESQAKERLSEGNYLDALLWLDSAARLNPTLNQVAFYHIERGQALYFLYPQKQSVDSSAFLGYLLRSHKDYRDAYRELLAIEQSNGVTPWIAEEMGTTLEKAVESISPLTGNADQPVSAGTVKKDNRALPWLQLLLRDAPNNLYGRYMLGRVTYDIRDYAQCKVQMALALTLSNDADVQSSAYTYMAFSDAGLADYAGERSLLLMAMRFDPSYHNNTAREELSGLR